MSGVALGEVPTPWGIPVSVAVFRKKVHHRGPKNYQLDLFDPNDGHDEYSAVTSNLDLTLASLWQFMCGRGGHEKTIGQLKHGLAFGSVPTASYAANSAWQQLVALTHNLLVNLQLAPGAAARPRSRKRTVLHTLHSIQTLRFVLFHRAGLIVRPQGTMQLRLTDNPATRALYTRISSALARAAGVIDALRLDDRRAWQPESDLGQHRRPCLIQNLPASLRHQILRFRGSAAPAKLAIPFIAPIDETRRTGQ